MSDAPEITHPPRMGCIVGQAWRRSFWLKLSQQPSQRAPQRGRTVPLEPAAMAEDDPLGPPLQQVGRRSGGLPAPQADDEAEVDRRFAVGGEHADETCGRAQPPGQFTGLKVHHEVGQHESPAGLVEKEDLAEPGAARENALFDFIGPGRRSRVAEVVVESEAALLDRGAVAQRRGGPGLGVRAGPLPILKKRPMRDVGGDEMPDAAEAVEVALEGRAEPRRRVEPKIAALQANYRHPDRERHAEHADRSAVDDPDALGYELWDIERRIGRPTAGQAVHGIPSEPRPSAPSAW